jgi:hypothetical protein
LFAALCPGVDPIQNFRTNVLSVCMLNAVLLSVVMLSVNMLGVNLLSGSILNVVILICILLFSTFTISGGAPQCCPQESGAQIAVINKEVLGS